MLGNHLENAIKVGEDVIVPEADDAVAVLGERRGTNHVAITLGVLPAVEFDNQVRFAAGKIGNVWTNGLLADEFMAEQLAVAQTGPEFAFSVSGIGAKGFGGLRGKFGFQ